MDEITKLERAMFREEIGRWAELVFQSAIYLLVIAALSKYVFC